MKKLTIVLTACIIILLAAGSLSAFSLTADNHMFNPALLGTSSRSTYEMGTSASAGLQNNYFTLGDFLSTDPVLVIDMDDLYAAVKIDGLQVNTQVFTEAHTQLHIWNIGVGAYAAIDGSLNSVVSSDLIKFLAEGNEIGETIEGSEGIDVKSFFEAGMYLGYKLSNYHIGVKVGQFLPLMVSNDLRYNYHFETKEAENPEDIVAYGWAEMSGTVYSVLNLENSERIIDNPLDLLAYGGYKIDAGVVYAKEQGKPLWGASVSVPVKPALAPFTYEAVGKVEITVTNPLGEDENGSEKFETVVDPEFDFILVDQAPIKEIMPPVRTGAFYRFTLIPLIDLIPHIEFIFDKPMIFNGGMTITGSSFPMDWISLGFDYRRSFWTASAALDMDFRVIELGIQVSNSAANFSKIFAFTGPQVSLHAAVGF